MSIWRGIQSAFFHYVSCAPCFALSARRKQSKQIKRDRAERDMLASEDPEAYRHPDPNATNEHWREEINMGPGPPPRRVKVKRSKEVTRMPPPSRAGTHSSLNSRDSLDIARVISGKGLGEGRISEDTLDGDNWNRKRYQREDEELWGFGEPPEIVSQHPSPPGSSLGSATGASRPGTAYSSTGNYATVRSPPVNDLHPPVVSLPSTNIQANKWMLQPPPRAKIMNGQEKANSTRSRSGSGTSSKVELSLQRQVSERKLYEKMQRGETPDMPSWSRANSFRAPSRVQSYDVNKISTTNPTAPQANLVQKPRSTQTDATKLGNEHNNVTVKPRLQTSQPPTSRPTSSSGFIRISTNSLKSSVTVAQNIKETPTGPTRKRSVPGNKSKRPKAPRFLSSDSANASPYAGRRRAPLLCTDQSALNVLQERLPQRPDLNQRNSYNPSSTTEKLALTSDVKSREWLEDPRRLDEDLLRQFEWIGSGFGVSREWIEAPRDLRNRWSMDI